MMRKKNRRPGQGVRRQTENLFQHHNTLAQNIRQQDTTTQKIAFRLLELGFSVIPANVDKTPAIPWKQYQQNRMVREEAKRTFPSNCCLAVIAGAVSGNLECLDIDDPDLFEPFLQALEEFHPGLKDKLCLRKTPHGYHIIYRCEKPVGGNKKLAMTKDNRVRIETRGEGGYFLHSPSKGYKVIRNSLEECAVLSVHEVGAIHLIAGMFDQRTSQEKQLKSNDFDSRPGDIFNQNNSIGNLVEKFGWKQDRKTTAGIGYTRPGKERGVSGVFLEETGNFYVFSSNASPLESGNSYSPFALYTAYKHNGNFKEAARELAKESSAGRKTTWTEPIPLPSGEVRATNQKYDLDLLPEPIKEASAEVARFSKVPEISPAVVALSCIATAIGKKAVVVERPGLEHHPAMFFALIAGSGERKSPVFSRMAWPLKHWAENQQVAYEAEKRETKAVNMAIDAALSALKSKAKKNLDDQNAVIKEIARQEARRKKEPPVPSLYTTDTSEERLFQKMHDRGGNYAVMTGEGRPAIDAIMGKYSGDGRTGEAIYLAGITGDTITRDRVGGVRGPEEKVIYKPCLNACIMVQPDKYMEAARNSSLRESGTLARIWPVFLPSFVGTRFEEVGEHGLNFRHMEAFNRLVGALLEIPCPGTGEQCHKAGLSKDAAEARRRFHNSIEEMMADGKDLDDVRDIACKAVTQTAKLALVIHLAENPDYLHAPDSTISVDTWARAQALGTYHLQQAVSVQRMAVEDKTIIMARRILKWIRVKDFQKLTVREVCQSGPRPRLKSREAKKVLILLEEHNYLRADQQKNNYLVNPHSNRSNCSRSSHCSRGEEEK